MYDWKAVLAHLETTRLDHRYSRAFKTSLMNEALERRAKQTAEWRLVIADCETKQTLRRTSPMSWDLAYKIGTRKRDKMSDRYEMIIELDLATAERNSAAGRSINAGSSSSSTI